jgi:gliding motility-associated-like protein
LGISLSSNAQVSPFNLLVNGDFESGGSGNGFQTPAPYNFLATLTGNSNPGDYAIIPNPQPMNTAYFLSGTDHSGTGKMIVIDGTTSGGNQRFWKAGSSGGGVGPLTVGQTYTFSYWIKSIASSVVDISTTADILVSWNNANNITLVSGNTLAPYPGNTATWQKVVYTFTPTNSYVNIELSNNNTNPVGNDFAIDDVEVLAPPQPLGVRYNAANPSCPNATDGFIAVYGIGGTPPYTYSFNGGPYTANNLFSGLGNVTNAFVSVKDAATPTAAVVFSPSNISLAGPANPLTIRPDSTICRGATLPLYASGSATGYTWTANPADPTIANPTAQNTTATPTQNTIYTVSTTVSRLRSLIYNGDFETGDVGFESQYTSFPFPPNPSNPSLAQRSYSIVNNAQQFEPVFQPCVDHSSGSGKMMVIDGSTAPNIKIWSQKVAVTPNTSYNIQYWLQSVVANSPAQIELQVNGTPVTGNAASSTTTAPPTTCSWIPVTYTWNSGANTTAEVTLINRNISSSGNDFAIDDISMTHSVSCTFSKTSNITVNAGSTPVTNFSYNTPVCINGTNPTPILPTGFTTGGVFSSTLGISINGSTGIINLPTSSPGTYTITYTVAASACQAAASSTAQITISSTITPVTGFSYSSPLCSSAGTVNPTTVSGFTSGGTFSSTTGLSINTSTGAINATASTPGTYTVTYSLAATSCQPASNSNASVTITASPTPPTTTPILRYCVNETAAALTATGSNLLWYDAPTGGTGSDSAPIPNTGTIGTTMYYVSQNIGGCESPRTPISVIVSPKPIVDAGANVFIAPGQSITLQGTTNAINPILSWSPSGTLSDPSILNPVASPASTTTYYLSVQSLGCTNKDSVIVAVIGNLIIPNVFSPNGDGIHDKWIIQGIEGYPDATVELFNRYGQSLFVRKGYNATNAWDGTLNGKAVPFGVYYYVIQGLTDRAPQTGSLTVLR